MQADCPLCRFKVLVRADEHKLALQPFPIGHLDEIQPGETGHADVRKDHIGLLFAQKGERFFRISKFPFDGETCRFPIDNLCQTLQRPRLVINDYNCIHGVHPFLSSSNCLSKTKHQEGHLLMFCLFSPIFLPETPSRPLEGVPFHENLSVKPNVVGQLHHHMQVTRGIDLFA